MVWTNISLRTIVRIISNKFPQIKITMNLKISRTKYALCLLMIFINMNVVARVLLTSNGETFSNLMGGGSYTYEITDQKSDDCNGEWFVGRLIWTGLQKTDNLCWRNSGSNLEVKKIGFFEKSVYLPKPVEIGDKDLTAETADLFYQKKNEQKVQDQRINDDKDRQFFAGRPIKEFPYQAKISCSYGSNQLPLMACMQNGNLTTNIEVRSGQDYSMAQFTNLNIANSMGSNGGLTVLLRPTFQIKMQNASKEMTMNLEILDRQSNAVAYKKSAGQFDYISANNNSISRSSQPSNSNSSAYEAEISCGYQPIFICFMKQGGVYGSFNTTLEIRSGNFYKLYQYQDLMNSGALMNVPLGSSFIINAQNSNNTFLLNIKIKDKTTKKVMFEKSAGQFDFIRIRN